MSYSGPRYKWSTAGPSINARARSRFGFGKGRMALPMAPAVRRTLSTARKFMVGEQRYLTTTSNAGVTTAGTFVVLNTLAQGDGAASRDSNRIVNQTLQFGWSVVGGDDTNFVRVLIFWDRQSQAAAITVADLLADVTVPTISAWNPTIGSRIQVLYDSNTAVTVGAASDGGPAAMTRQVRRLRLKDKISWYNDTAAAQGPITNQLMCLLISDSGIAPNPTVAFTGTLTFLP